jgi:putative transposase
VTQRGHRRQQIFFSDEDDAEYRRLLSTSCPACGTQVLVYCHMPNHVHLILVPGDELGLRDALGEAHRRDTRMINVREGWRGHLWQERFHAFVMDERYLIAAARSVELNPVRARPEDWPWSSARAHLAGANEELVSVRPLLELIPDWARFIGEPDAPDVADVLHAHTGPGRQLGPDSFVEALEQRLRRPLKRKKPGPKPPRRGRAVVMDLSCDAVCCCQSRRLKLVVPAAMG